MLPGLVSWLAVGGIHSYVICYSQMPIFLSVFIGIRHMTNVPVESMTTGGILWFTDLTVTDPYFALPLITVATLLATLEVTFESLFFSASMHKYLLFIYKIIYFQFEVQAMLQIGSTPHCVSCQLRCRNFFVPAVPRMNFKIMNRVLYTGYIIYITGLLQVLDFLERPGI